MSSEPIIRVENLTFQYPAGTHKVLESINLEVRPGEFLGITGPSGAGKSTLCLCLKGLIPHAISGKMGGTVTVLGKSTRTTPPSDLAQEVAMVFQDPESQIIGLTVLEDLAFGPENLNRPGPEILKMVPEMLKTVRLQGFEERETYSLSGGQKQRTAIAAALMMEPRVLILDEPTSELDPIGKEEVFATVRRLREERQVTVIMVEHEIEQLAEVADRIIVMDGGRILADAPPRELFRNVELFHRTQGERLPQVAELLTVLESQGILEPGQFTPYEDEAVAVLENLLRRVNRS